MCEGQAELDGAAINARTGDKAMENRYERQTTKGSPELALFALAVMVVIAYLLV